MGHKGSTKGSRTADGMDSGQGIPMKSANLKKIFIQRDYTSGTATRFNAQFPEDLNGRVDRQQFEQFINHLNEIYEDAEKMTSRTCCESCLACFTAYFVYMCLETYYDKCMKRSAAFIEERNETLFKPNGVLITDPIERGLRVIEITLFSNPNNPDQNGGGAIDQQGQHTAQNGRQTNNSGGTSGRHNVMPNVPNIASHPSQNQQQQLHHHSMVQSQHHTHH